MTDVLPQVKQALDTLYGTSDATLKSSANRFLLEFQRSKDAWQLLFPVLGDSNADFQLQVFMAQTLRSKIQYDFGQLPENAIESLRNSVLQLLITFTEPKYKIIVRQASIALVYLTMQDFTWKNSIPQIIEILSNSNSFNNLFEFLKILPEEMIDVGKTPLTSEEFDLQTQNLLINNVERVLVILNRVSQNKASNSGEINVSILNCIKSWLFEVPVSDIMQKYPNLWPIVVLGFKDDETFETSVDCLITIVTEIDIFNSDNFMPFVQLVYDFLISLAPFVQENWDDSIIIERLTELFSIAGESWHTLIVKNPTSFSQLVEIILTLSSYPSDLDIVKYTFKFWNELRSMLILPPYADARIMFKPIYLKLADVLIQHLKYPLTSDSTDLSILFEGNKESEDKFKDSRYEIGDVLKDCCSVSGAYDTLNVPFQKLQSLINGTSSSNQIKWQEIESLLFSIRSMAKEVGDNENKMMPQIMEYLVQLPENPKTRYAATLVLGRYTKWTSKHSQYLEIELNYITSGFQVENSNYSANDKRDIIIAASHALKYFCIDCAELLSNYVPALHNVYVNVINEVDIQSIYDISEGLAYVLRNIIIKDENGPEISNILQLFWSVTLEKLKLIFDTNCSNEGEFHELSTQIADTVEVLTIYVDILKPKNINLPTNGTANIVMEAVLPLIFQLIKKFGKASRVSERCLKFIRRCMQTFKNYLLPSLNNIAELLLWGYKEFEFGCYLWVSGTFISEYSDEEYGEQILSSVWNFGFEQIKSFLQIFSKSCQDGTVTELSILVEDFFSMMKDVLMFQPFQLLECDDIIPSLYEVAIKSIDTYQEDATLESIFGFMIDFFMWGNESPPVSFVADVPIELKRKIHSIVESKGSEMISKLLFLNIYKFSHDICHDSLELVVEVIKLSVYLNNKHVSLIWLGSFLNTLPDNFVSESEKSKLLRTVESAISSGNYRKIRAGISDFVSWYKRKMVSRNYE
ncbi:Mtr10 protein [Martiniozyma asiatica (nom. inval.)]|nr:Mtr10 protein [Martiniozyma asiatica]